jgi:uncharacterized membrane protein YvbJ
LQGLTELDEYKKEMSLKQNTNETTGAVRKAVQNKQISIIIISLLLLIIILFYFSFKTRN